MGPTNKHRKGQHLTFECRVLIQTNSTYCDNLHFLLYFYQIWVNMSTP
jgi:hypothetical protein